MDALDPERIMHPNKHRDPPPRYEDYDGDDYPSEEDLEDHDLNVLKTDYAAQRDLSFYPVQQNHNDHYNPSLPPSLRQSRDSADDIHNNSDKYIASTYEWNDGSRVPPRTTSLDKSMYAGSNDRRLSQHNARAYQTHRKRRPLIDLIRNEWQNSPYTSSSSSPTSPGYSTPNWIQVLRAPRFRRYAIIVLGILSLMWGNWHYWAGPQWTEYRLLNESLNERIRTGGGWFGENIRPEFLDMVHVKTLDQGLVPQQDDGNRLIVVGDVHGCHDELVNLLAEIQYEARTDHLIFAGDFISKGPSSHAVVDLAMSAHASCVRGNHEDRVLLAYRDIYSHRMTAEQRAKTPPPPPEGMPEDMLQNEPLEIDQEIAGFEHGDGVDRKLARSLTKRQVDYMASCPVILDVGQVKGMGEVHVVHAGLIPGVRLERQDPMGVMHMRTIDLDTHVPSSSSKGMAWFKLWNKYQSLIPAHQRSTVIYGHDSRRGLQLHDYSKGLDSGCVKGGRLSALVIDNNVSGGEAKVVSVQCKDYREPKKEEVVDEGEVE